MNNYIYQKSVEYTSFKTRFWDKATLIVVLMSMQAVIIMVVAIALRAWYLTFVAAFIGFGGFINAYIFRRRIRYFLQQIAVDKNLMVNLDLYLKDENLHISLPLSSFSVKLKRSFGKDRHIKLSFFDEDKLIGFQHDDRRWKLENMAEVFRSIKELKNEPLTAQEERMLTQKGFFG